MHYIRTGRFYTRLKLLLSWEGGNEKQKTAGKIRLNSFSCRRELKQRREYVMTYHYRTVVGSRNGGREDTMGVRVWVDKGGRCGSSD